MTEEDTFELGECNMGQNTGCPYLKKGECLVQMVSRVINRESENCDSVYK